MAASKLFLHAPNVHQGGGRTLLLALLEELPTDQPVVCHLDSRLAAPRPHRENVSMKLFPPTILGRIRAEQALTSSARNDRIFCFGNLPPLFPVAAGVSLFVQNTFVLGLEPLRGFPLKTRCRLNVEQLWFRLRQSAVNEFLVQTESMGIAVQRRIGTDRSLRVCPFIPQPLHDQLVQRRPDEKVDVATASTRHAQDTIDSFAIADHSTIPFQKLPVSSTYRVPASKLPLHQSGDGKRFDFCYVASGEPHKNHRRLIDAWIILAGQNQFPTLCLTLNEQREPQLCAEIAHAVHQHRLRITNLGTLSADEVAGVYSSSRCLLFPSLRESYGLPLLEAAAAGLPIVASERDYVRDVVTPQETFDPESARSIARAVQRSIGAEQALGSPLNATQFWQQLTAA